MTKIEELENKIKECQKEIDELTGMYDELEQELKELKKSEKKSKRWKPSSQDLYFYIDSCGTVTWGTYDNNDWHNYHIKHNNYFKTKEEAKNHAYNLETEALLRQYAEEHNTEEIDWENGEQIKFYILYDCENETWEWDSTEYKIKKLPRQIYFTSYQLIHKAIEEIRRRKSNKVSKGDVNI